MRTTTSLGPDPATVVPSADGAGVRVSATLLFIGLAVASLFLLTQGRGAAVNSWMVWLLVLILLFGIRRPKLALYILAFAIPFEFIFYAWGGGRYQMLAYPAVILAGYWTLARRGFPGRFRPYESAFLAFLCWAGISLLWTPDLLNGLEILFALSGSFAYFYVVPRVGVGERDARRFIGFYLAGLALYTVLIAGYYEQTTLVEYYGRQYLSTFGTADEVSHYEYGNACAVAFFGSLGLWEFSESRRVRRTALGAAVLLAGALFLTLSRALTIELLLGLFTWGVLVPRRKRATARLFGGLLVLALALGISAGVNSSALEWRWDNTVVRFQAGDLRSLTSGRTWIWGTGVDIWETSAVTGVGLGQFSSSFFEATGIRKGSHSSVVESLVELGVPGLGLFLLFMGFLGMAAWKAGRWRHVTMAWWVYFVVEAILNGHGRNKAAWFAVGLIGLLHKVAQERQQEEDDGMPPPDSAGVAVAASAGG